MRRTLIIGATVLALSATAAVAMAGTGPRADVESQVAAAVTGHDIDPIVMKVMDKIEAARQAYTDHVADPAHDAVRDHAGDHAADVVDRAHEVADPVRDMDRDRTMDQMRDAVGEVVDRAHEVADPVREAVRDMVTDRAADHGTGAGVPDDVPPVPGHDTTPEPPMTGGPAAGHMDR